MAGCFWKAVFFFDSFAFKPFIRKKPYLKNKKSLHPIEHIHSSMTGRPGLVFNNRPNQLLPTSTVYLGGSKIMTFFIWTYCLQ